MKILPLVVVSVLRPPFPVVLMSFLMLIFCGFLVPSAAAQQVPISAPVLFWEEGFPTADTSPISQAQAQPLFTKFTPADSKTLSAALTSANTLILPYGSAFPEAAWPAIESFLQRGGNLVALGGKPFARPAYIKDGRWELRPETLAYSRALRIFGYQPTAGSDGLEQSANGLTLPKLSWRQAWSVTIRLSETASNDRDGATGTLDADLNTLLWGTRGDHRLSAPLIQIDHLSRAFIGGRWLLLASDIPGDFWNSKDAPVLINTLVNRATTGAQRFTLEPQYAVFAPNEPWRFELNWVHPNHTPVPLKIELAIDSEGAASRKETLDFTPAQLPFLVGFQVAPTPAKGLVKIHARLLEGQTEVASNDTGFWMRDDTALRSGPVVSLNSDYFLIDGKVQPVVGTTQMASDVQRRYFEHPNVFVWNHDMDQIQRAGLNMLRAGWWTGWENITENGIPTEKSLRALEAYLLTAQKHHLPVQFTFFAFEPEVLGGKNPYLDPAAVSAQQQLIRTVVDRFRDVPYLVYDLINEPSFSNPKRMWQTRPNNDVFEQRAWTDWLLQRYGDRASVAAAWHVTPLPNDGLIPLPADSDFSSRNTISGNSAARGHDYIVFAQESFAAWSKTLRDTIRAAGSKQFVTVGQDEGGVGDRLLTSYFGANMDFTTNHTWWLNDVLLWDSLAAKLPGKPLLIQETGVQHEASLDGFTRRTEENEGWLVERKIATALATSAGAIQWLWNTNDYMMPEQELPIGALRPDGTVKPEGLALERFAKFARDNATYFAEPAPPEVAVVTSQVMQFSPYIQEGVAAQQRAVRSLDYDLHISSSVVAENQIDNLGHPKLVILPSPQALRQHTWDRLLEYVRSGGHLLVTGPVERDEHWYLANRLSQLLVPQKPMAPQVPASESRLNLGPSLAIPLLTHYSELKLGDEKIPLTYEYTQQQHLERLNSPESFHDIPLGSGHLYVTSDPVELAESPQPISQLYSSILKRVDLKPAYDSKSLPNSVLIRATSLRDAMLYLLVNESNAPQNLNIKDRSTGAELKVNLASQRARLAIIRKSDKKIFWSPE